MESKWRTNVLELGLSGTRWRMIARYLVFMGGWQYHAKRDDGTPWRLIVNTSPAGAINVTQTPGTLIPWTALMNAGIIEPD